jgi:hypothetical protein
MIEICHRLLIACSLTDQTMLSLMVWHVIERMPLAEKLGVGHLQFE